MPCCFVVDDFADDLFDFDVGKYVLLVGLLQLNFKADFSQVLIDCGEGLSHSCNCREEAIDGVCNPLEFKFIYLYLFVLVRFGVRELQRELEFNAELAFKHAENLY
jgi:hypothetical protein